MNHDKENWADVLVSMGKALNEMRVNYEQDIRLKNLNQINNPLFQKRIAKTGNAFIKKVELDDEATKSQKFLKPDTEVINEDNISINSKKSIKIEELKLKRQYSEPATKNTLTALYYSSNLRNH